MSKGEIVLDEAPATTLQEYVHVSVDIMEQSVSIKQFWVREPIREYKLFNM